jgi:3-oxoacyl-[acyl-carrier-protein] synthase III
MEHTAVIRGTGIYVPGEAISNEELARITGLSMDGEKLEGKLGIKERHIAHLRDIDETAADFATHAAARAIEDAGLSAEEVDLFIVASDTPEYISPATAILVQGRLQKGEKQVGAFDVASSCASFTMALDVASRMVSSDPEIRHAVVVGVYNMPAFFRPDDPFAYSIFADGAGAMLLSREKQANSGYITGKRVSDGTQWNYIGVYSGGARQPITLERLNKGEYGLQLLQNLPGDRNINLWPPLSRELVKKAGVKLSEVDHFIFTQINASVIRKVMALLEEPEEKALMVMDRYGYTGSACVPMAFHQGVKEEKIKPGDLVLTMASGAGFSVAANIFRY